MTDLFVAEDTRGQGAAQALLAAMQEHALGLGIHRMQISIHARNPRAAAAYRRFGFSDYTLYLEKILPGGEI